MPSPPRPRGREVLPFPSSRRAVTAVVRAGRRILPMHGLLDVDVTEARYCRCRLVRHSHVDVQALIEVPTVQAPFGLVHVVRDADVRSVADLSTELHAVRTNLSSTASGRALQRLAPLAGRVPGVFPAMYAVMSRSVRAHEVAGTVQVTAVGMFAGGGGLALAPPTLASLLVVVRGMSRRPRVVGDQIAVREVLDLTVTIDHNVVDGAPATRFGADLRRRMEHPIIDAVPGI